MHMVKHVEKALFQLLNRSERADGVIHIAIPDRRSVLFEGHCSINLGSHGIVSNSPFISYGVRKAHIKHICGKRLATILP